MREEVQVGVCKTTKGGRETEGVRYSIIFGVIPILLPHPSLTFQHARTLPVPSPPNLS